MRLYQRPYHLLLLTAILLFIGGLFSINTPIDVHLHDTYFVFPLSFLVWVLTLILFFFWSLYLATRQFLFSKKLTWIHVILTVLSSLFMLMLPYLSTYSYSGTGGPRIYYDYEELNRFKIFGNLTSNSITAFAFLLSAQLIYFANLFVGLYKGVGRQKNI